MSDYQLDDKKYIPDDLPNDVRYGFTRQGLNMVLHHAHRIAKNQGFTARFMEKNWPGLTWQEARDGAEEAGVWVKNSQHFSVLALAEHVHEFHILQDGSTRIILVPTSGTVEEAAQTDDDDNLAGGGFDVTIEKDFFDMSYQEQRNFLRRALSGISPNPEVRRAARSSDDQ